MKTIIICLLAVLIFSGYKALTSDNSLQKKTDIARYSKEALQYKLEAIHDIVTFPYRISENLNNKQTNDDYIVEITEEEDDE